MKALITCLLLLCSCAPISLFIRNNKSGPVILCNKKNLYVISDNVPEMYAKTIKEGIEYWNKGVEKEVLIDSGRASFAPGKIRSINYIIVGVADMDDPMSEDALGVTRLDYKYNCINGAVVSIKSKYFRNNEDANDLVFLQNIVRHEIGHVIGLAHCPFREELMYKELRRGPWLKTIHSSTMEIIKELYK